MICCGPIMTFRGFRTRGGDGGECLMDKSESHVVDENQSPLCEGPTADDSISFPSSCAHLLTLHPPSHSLCYIPQDRTGPSTSLYPPVMTTPHVIASSSSHPSQSSTSHGIVGNHYRVGKKIGEGSFGVVFEGLCPHLRPPACHLPPVQPSSRLTAQSTIVPSSAMLQPREP